MLHINYSLPYRNQSRATLRSNSSQEKQLIIPKPFVNQLPQANNQKSKQKNFYFLYDEIRIKVQNDLKRNLSPKNNEAQEKPNRNRNKKVISQFRLRLSKSIEKYMNKQDDLSMLKIQSYQESESHLSSPRQIMLKARSSRNSGIKSKEKFPKVLSHHDENNPYMLQVSHQILNQQEGQMQQHYYLRPILTKK